MPPEITEQNEERLSTELKPNFIERAATPEMETPSHESTTESEPQPAEVPEQAARPQTIAPPNLTPRQVDEIMLRVEKILEEDLNEAYHRLSPLAKQEFKIKGEQAAKKIRDLMRGATLKVKKIFKLILDWLKLLPGINRFFLEQEAKIKTDRIIALHHSR